MKKSNYLLLGIFFLIFNLIKAQEEKASKFSIMAYGGIGYGTIENDNAPNYNLNSNGGDILLSYNINQELGIATATGIGMNELSGNGFNAVGNFYHERTLLKVPLLFTINRKIAENFGMAVNLGLYGQNIIKDEYRFLNNTQKDVYNGWNFGAQGGFGFIFEVFDNFNVGINYNFQSDFNKFQSNNNGGVDDKQKMKNLNSIGIILMVKL